MVLRFDRLPNEIQRMVFHILRNDASGISEYILVCKAWKHIWQPLLYQSIYLDSALEMASLLDSFESNDDLQSLVHQLKFNFRIDLGNLAQNIIVTKLFTYLFKLEKIYISCGGYYGRLAEALALNRLLSLKYVSPPKRTIDTQDYNICALLLRDRLTELKINDTLDTGEQTSRGLPVVSVMKDRVRFYTLYNELAQFKNLTSLHLVRSAIDIIDLLEDVTAICPSLRRITVDVTPTREASITAIDITSSSISGFTPANHIDYLHICKSIIHDPQVVLYVLHKFPQVKSLILLRQLIPNGNFDKFTMNKFMEFLSKLTYAEVKSIPWKKRDTINYIRSFWSTISQSHAMDVQFKYHNQTIADRMDIEVNHGVCTNTIYYSHLQMGMEHTDIIKEHGSLFRTLIFHEVVPDIVTSKRSLIEILLVQTLQCCPNLKTLWILHSYLSTTGRPSFISHKNYSLQFLRIVNCIFVEGDAIYYKVTHTIAYLKYLEISSNRFLIEPNNRNIPLKNINMPATHVIALSLSKYGEHVCKGCCKERVLLMNVTAERHKSYYIYDLDSMDNLLFMPIQKDEFDHLKSALNDVLEIGVHFKSLKRVEVHHARQIVKLNKVLVD